MIDLMLKPLVNWMNSVPTFSPSQMATYEECPQHWKYIYVDRLARVSSGNFKMNRGTYFHRLCHFFYDLKKQGLREETIIAAMGRKFAQDLQQINKDNLPLFHSVLPLIDSYIKDRSPVIDRGMQVLAVEYEYWVPVVTPKGRIVALHGFIDLVYRDTWNKIRIRDHKTSERIDQWSMDKVLFNPQLRDYDLALSLSNPWNLQVGGVEINFINTKEYGEKSKAKGRDKIFDLYNGQYTDVQRVEFLRNKLKKIDLILDGDITRNYSKDCNTCSHFPICYREEKGLPTAATIATQFVRINKKANVLEDQPRDTKENEPSTERLTPGNKANFTLSLNLH